MNAVEIEEAVSELGTAPFDAAEFPFAFLTAFGRGHTTLRKLRAGDSNNSDAGGVLQRSHIHIAVAEPGQTVEKLAELRGSSQTARQKAKFILATDGVQIEAEELASGEAMTCAYGDLGRNFGFFLPLAGITTVKEVKNNPIDIKATSRLNKLYVELLRENADWATAERRQELNQFMARLIFCFFAEDTGIFNGTDLFTETVRKMSEPNGANTHEVLQELFRAMSTKAPKGGGVRPGFPSWADQFPYVNGGLFQGATDCPRFTRIARSYLLRAGELDWRTINPDIFGSMIQAVAEDDERGELGMHYTSVPNIQKVLDPLFLDSLREQLEAAGTNKRKLFNLRQRLSRVRVFDPACGSGNFLVIAYIRMREVEDEIMRRRGEALERSAIALTQFYGIEIKSFAAEIARLSLLIAEFQCDVRFIGQAEARALVLPLHATGNIRQGNALRIDWEDVCPPATVSAEEQDLGGPTGRLNLEGGGEVWETYICGNPPYLGKGKKEKQHIADMERIFSNRTKKWGYIDYVGCWLVLASDYCRNTSARSALVATNSIGQGRQLPQLWPCILKDEIEIFFAHQSFKWSNNAMHNAGVICVVVGIAPMRFIKKKRIFEDDLVRSAEHINAYLISGADIYVESVSRAISASLARLVTGSVPNDEGNLIFSPTERDEVISEAHRTKDLFHLFQGSQDYLKGLIRYCIVIPDELAEPVRASRVLDGRLDAVAELRRKSKKKEAREFLSKVPHRFQHRAGIPTKHAIIVPSVSSERREWFPAGVAPRGTVVSNLAFMMLDAPLWNLSIVCSKMHLAWLTTVCGKLKTDYRYSNTLGWNTFPVPKLTETDNANLTACAEDILLAREAHFPATIAELYDPEKMPGDLRAAHDRNDETLERIYIGRRFRNDTERLEKLFDMYTKMTGADKKTGASA